MRIAMLGPVAWRTPPRHYGPWEQTTSLLTEGLVERGIDVTLFATADSKTAGRLHSVVPRGYEEDQEIDAKVAEALHIASVFERAEEFDIIHNQFDFLPLTYSRLVDTPVITTIHGFSSREIIPVYQEYDERVHYISISDADRAPELSYLRTIYHGIDLKHFTFRPDSGEYLLFFGRIHPDKGAADAVAIARTTGYRLKIAGIIQDQDYFTKKVEPWIDGEQIVYLGSVGPTERDNLLGNALCLLHPIWFDEPFGLSVVESMACGTPVIAYRRGSMPELISDELDGLLVDGLDEAVEKLESIRNIDRRLPRHTVERRFTVDRMVEEYLQAYEEIVNQKIKN